MQRERSFIFYESFRDAVKDLPGDTQLCIYNAIIDYALYGTEPDFGDDVFSSGFFKLMRPQIDANIKRRENGRKGGRPADDFEPSDNQDETNPEPSDNQDETNPEPNVNVNVNVNANANDNANVSSAGKPRRFTPPTVEEVAAYCRERGNAVNARSFVDFYASKGWVVGKSPMKDWRAAVRTWEQRDGNGRRDGPATPRKVLRAADLGWTP